MKSTDKELTDTLILNGEKVGVADMKRFWRERPDPDFNARHNEEVIERSIQRAIKFREQQAKLQQEGLAERVDALSTYVKARASGKTHKTAEEYFGKKTLAHLQGKKVMQILQERKANGLPLWRVINTE